MVVTGVDKLAMKQDVVADMAADMEVDKNADMEVDFYSEMLASCDREKKVLE